MAKQHSVKELIKMFVPPITISFINKLMNVNNDNAKVYKSYSEALKDSDRLPYQSDDLVNLVFKKTNNFINNLRTSDYADLSPTTINLLTAVLLTILLKKSETVIVVDFGGACGALYFQIRKILDKKYKLNYCVVELPRTVTIAKANENEELFFTDNLADAISRCNGAIDLLHVSSVIQYLDEPYKYLQQLLDCKAQLLLFNRMCMTLGDHDIISVQKTRFHNHGIGSAVDEFPDRIVKSPHTNIQKSIFDSLLKEKYEIVYFFNDNSSLHKVGDEPIIGFGLLCKYKA